MKDVKLFESYNRIYDIKEELIQQLDGDFIEEYYNNNYKMPADEILENWPSSIWFAIDDDRYIEDCIIDDVFSFEINDFVEYEFIQYIKNNLNNNIKKSVIEKYKELNYVEDDDENEEDIEYDESMLDEFSTDDFVSIIEDCDREDKFKDYIIRKRYEGEDAESIFDNIYGKKYINKLGYEELDKMYGRYIDTDKIEQHFIDETSYTRKVEQLVEDLENNKKLQKKLLKKDPSNSLLLFDIFEKNNESGNIGHNYDFQKTYIEEYVKNNIYIGDEDEDEDEKEENISELKIDAVKQLYDKFGINKNIEKEYNKYTRLIDMDKYNL